MGRSRLFFVLSGYLITTILITNRQDPHYFVNFYGRRALRIWPIYYLALIPLLVAYLFLPTKYPINTGIALQYLTYTQNIQHIWFDQTGRTLQAFSHTWTLAIEEQFYLLWPLVVRTTSRRLLAFLCVAIATTSVALRNAGLFWDVLPARCDGFAIGAFLAILLSTRGLASTRCVRMISLLSVSIVGGGAMVAICLRVSGPGSTPWRYSELLSGGPGMVGPLNLLFFGLIGLVILQSGKAWLFFLRLRPLIYLGTISYGLYLYHIPVVFMVDGIFRLFGSGHRFDGTRPLFRSIVELTASIMLASLSWQFLERPILALKRYLPYQVERIDSSLQTTTNPL